MSAPPARYLKADEEALLLSVAQVLLPDAKPEAICNLLHAAAAMGAFNALLMARTPRGGVQ